MSGDIWIVPAGVGAPSPCWVEARAAAQAPTTPGAALTIETHPAPVSPLSDEVPAHLKLVSLLVSPPSRGHQALPGVCRGPGLPQLPHL